MATALKDIYNGQPGTTNTKLYTSSTGVRTRILAAVVTNDTTTSAYINIHRVPSGSTATDEYLIVNRKTVYSRETVSLWEIVGQVLEPGDFLAFVIPDVIKPS